MNIKKTIQKLMPSGRELILQGDAFVDDGTVRLIVRKRFINDLSAKAWYEEQKGCIRSTIASIENILSEKGE